MNLDKTETYRIRSLQFPCYTYKNEGIGVVTREIGVVAGGEEDLEESSVCNIRICHFHLSSTWCGHERKVWSCSRSVI